MTDPEYSGFDPASGPDTGVYSIDYGRVLTLRITKNLERRTTICTVEIPDKIEFEAPKGPRYAAIVEEGVMWASYNDELEGVGRQLKPEGLAMKFLRLAWLAAHVELGTTHAPFDGDARPISVWRLHENVAFNAMHGSEI